METQIIWTWKQEPQSPSVDFESDSWFYLGNNAVEVETTEEEVKQTRAETATKLLEDLDQWIKDEPFSDWLEEKIDLPIFEDLPVAGPLPSNTEVGLKAQVSSVPLQPLVIPIPASVPLNEPTVLIPEFEYVLNDETLTPPESPREAEMVLTMLQEMQPHELDELVRMRVESLVDSPDSFENSSRSSSQEESDSASSPSCDSGYDDPDPEWMPEQSLELKAIKKRRTTKPYSRTPPEEKKQRKKEQNKNAATRYRMKKKAEIEEILGEEKSLIDRNDQLKTDMNELAREIKYLKSLMREVFKAKGLIK